MEDLRVFRESMTGYENKINIDVRIRHGLPTSSEQPSAEGRMVDHLQAPRPIAIKSQEYREDAIPGEERAPQAATR